MLLFLPQPTELRPLAHLCLLSYWHLPYRVPQQFNETHYRQFPIFCLAAGLLRYDAKEPSLADTIHRAAHDEIFLVCGRTWRVLLVKPQGHQAAHLVNILSNLTQQW